MWLTTRLLFQEWKQKFTQMTQELEADRILRSQVGSRVLRDNFDITLSYVTICAKVVSIDNV